MDWKVYAAGTTVVVILGLAWLAWRNWPRLVKWHAEWNQTIGRKMERTEANAAASVAREQAQANAENARRENSVLPLDIARQRARRKWHKEDTE